MDHTKLKTSDIAALFSCRAFTLAELLVVVVILAIASLVVIPVIGNSGDLHVAAAARKLACDLLYVQTYAISKQGKYLIVFDSLADNYEIQDQDGSVISNPVSNVDYRVDFVNDPEFKSVVMDSALFDASNKIWFDQLGAPYSGNIVDSTPLTAGSVSLSSGDNVATVTIEPVTGRINVN